MNRQKFFKSLTISAITLLSCKDKPAGQSQATPYTEEDLFYAIAIVESGRDNTKVGAAGEVGMYQITRTYVDDVNRVLEIRDGSTSLFFIPNDRLSPAAVETMMQIYWSHYATFNRLGRQPTFEDKARIHNGGPNGWKKASTLKYWQKVKTVFERQTKMSKIEFPFEPNEKVKTAFRNDVTVGKVVKLMTAALVVAAAGMVKNPWKVLEQEHSEITDIVDADTNLIYNHFTQEVDLKAKI